MTKKRPITTYIVIAMILGVIVGYSCHQAFPDPGTTKEIAGYISIFTDVFLRLIKMIIAPLVFSTLVVGIAHMGDASTVGRVGVKALGWFIVASFLSLTLGLILATLLQPGHNIGLPLPDVGAATNLKTNAFTLKDFVTHLVPRSVAEAMATNEILQIVVFSIFFGTALSTLGETGKRLAGVIDDLAQTMLKITGAVMWMAPVAVFAAIASTVTTQGLGILLTFAKFMGSFYLGLVVLWSLLVAAGFFFLGKRVFTLIRLIREPFLLSFSTASSEAAYPKMLTALDRFGVSRKISSFVLPMGYSFNLDGTMMYCTFAVLFIAQAYDIHLPIGTQITMLLLLMLTSKGMAGVPRASLVVIAATLNQFGIPEAGLLLIMGVDQFLDMGRSATNAVGNSIAAAVVAKWEGQLASESDLEGEGDEAATGAALGKAEAAQA
ncbi:dicarboxylate/amino acid:cation (Na+ or H+) symporter, DAACS family protein [Cupriavidus basilensis OR16]|uniref:Dicarboxylate/amino acid:cation (Na+ or H+) symporter, DAACS family protein n=1 Tax=Cupriavidus basilensis OR16 TaxID=1127483 RepID=H1S150_9BURK|nr:dicarboxylate/amino acid:cation symporter [Cupriavidus basilensis]EHP43866.1 dicarboxylate/amino acid:cation (Na+ or H+) symporter, DAACS family protein [Cupriavidus basilensis OR16]